MKREQKHSERKYRKIKLEIDRQIYTNTCKSLYKLLDNFKMAYYYSRIKHHKTDCNDIFRLTKDLMGSNRDIALPSHICRK